MRMRTRTTDDTVMDSVAAAKQDPELFDLVEVVQQWVRNEFYNLADKRTRKLRESEVDFKLAWDDVVCWSDPPVFYDNHSVQMPKCQALFNSSYRNQTEGVQEYNFRTDRTTRSTADIEISKGYTAHRELGVKLQLPNQVLEMNAGFSQEISLSEATRQSLEEELTWGIDTRVEVQPKKIANIEVNIIEHKLTARFSVESRLRGRIRAVCLNRRKNNAFLMYLEADLGDVVRAHLAKPRPPSETKMAHVKIESPRAPGPKIVVITTEGKCAFRFGVKQEIEVNQVDAT